VRQVNQSPNLGSGDMRNPLTEILRDHGFAINQLIPKLVATASLPAANAALNGTIIFEDAGVNDVNLVIYAKGQRYRIDGGSPF
jgi:hypothetical protein